MLAVLELAVVLDLERRGLLDKGAGGAMGMFRIVN